MLPRSVLTLLSTTRLILDFLLGSTVINGYDFQPASYPKHSVTCPAIQRSPVLAQVHIRLNYVDINKKATSTMIMVHGWPSLWSAWARQISEFETDYRLIIPDLRGFGGSTHPQDARSSGSMGDIVGDLVCILDHAGVGSAICMGHDWGSQVCYEAARARPDIFKAVVGITVPYIPADGPFIGIEELVPSFPKLTYQIYFDKKTEAAIAELDHDIRRSIRATLRTVASPPPPSFLGNKTSYLYAYLDQTEIPSVPFFTLQEEDYFVNEFSIQGFRYTLQFYTHENRYQSWFDAHEQGNATVPCPVLAILPTKDPVADWVAVSAVLRSESFLPKLKTELVLGGHWVQLENPDEVNGVIRSWLRIWEGPPTAVHASEKRVWDEL